MKRDELNKWRQRNGYSQSQWAKVLGVDVHDSFALGKGSQGNPFFPAFSFGLSGIEGKGDTTNRKTTTGKEVREMACITKRRGRYVIHRYDQHGKRYRKTLKAGTTKDNARKALREIEDRISRRTFMPDKKTPLFAEVSKKWLEHKKKAVSSRETTWEVYESNVTTHLKELDGLRITEITTVDIERFISRLQNKFRSTRKRRKAGEVQKEVEAVKEGKKIALGTVRKVITILGKSWPMRSGTG